MTNSFHFAGRLFVALLLIASGLSNFGCGDSATVTESAALGNLSVSDGTLDPAFNPATTSYTVQLPIDISSTTITASPRVAGDSIRIDNLQTTSQTITLDSPGAEQTITIVVTDTGTGGTSKSYSVKFQRAAQNGNNSLASLGFSPGALAESFRADLTRYTASVANNIDAVTITPTLSDPAATMTVNGQPATSGQTRTITLSGGGQTTTIPIVITAQNGTSKSYEVAVSRGASSNNNLQGLTTNPGTLDPSFRANRTGYTVNLPATLASNVTNVRLTPSLQDATATMTVNGQAATSGQAQNTTLPAPGSSVTNNIIVVAQNGTPKVYAVNVVRAALGGNNNLSALTVRLSTSSANLISFSSNTTSYTVDVASTVTSIRVTPTLDDTAATLTVTSNGPGPITTSGQAHIITLRDAGLSTTITIAVRAPNGSEKPYTIIVDRAAVPPPSGNNNLQNLTVSPGNLNPAFSATRARTDYTVNDISSSATSITVTATPQDSGATVEINGQAGNSRSIPLPTGPSLTDIEVRVIAPDLTPKTYSITVNQPGPAAPPAPANAPDLIREDDSCTAGAPPDECAAGTSKVDNFTNVLRPRFLLAPAPAAEETPKLYIDGVEVEATFDRNTNHLQPASPLTASDEGVQHSITYTLTNTGGESAKSPSLDVTIMTGAPGEPT